MENRVIAYITDNCCGNKSFKVIGTLRRNEMDLDRISYIIDDEERGGNRIFPLAKRDVEIFSILGPDFPVDIPT